MLTGNTERREQVEQHLCEGEGKCECRLPRRVGARQGERIEDDRHDYGIVESRV